MRRKSNYTGFGLQVINTLNQLNMTQRDLCVGTGISFTTLSETLTGKRNNPERENMIIQYLRKIREEEGGEDRAI